MPAAGPGGAHPVEDPGWRADDLAALDARDKPDQSAHRADSEPAVDAVAGVTVQAASRTRAEVPLDVMR